MEEPTPLKCVGCRFESDFGHLCEFFAQVMGTGIPRGLKSPGLGVRIPLCASRLLTLVNGRSRASGDCW